MLIFYTISKGTFEKIFAIQSFVYKYVFFFVILHFRLFHTLLNGNFIICCHLLDTIFTILEKFADKYSGFTNKGLQCLQRLLETESFGFY